MNEEYLKLLYQLYLLKYFDALKLEAMNEAIDVNKLYREFKRRQRVEKLNKINNTD